MRFGRSICLDPNYRCAIVYAQAFGRVWVLQYWPRFEFGSAPFVSSKHHA